MSSKPEPRDLASLTDAAVLAELGERLSRVRLQRNLAQAQVAREAGVSKRTLVRLEKGESSQLQTLVRVLRALGLLHNLDALVPPALPSPMEQLRMQGRERRRASPRSQETQRSQKQSPPSTGWRRVATGGDPGGESEIDRGSSTAREES